MSSRTGTIISAESLIEQVKKLVKAKVEEPASAQGSGLARREMSEKEKEELSEIVAIGAIKYSILRQAIGGDTIFDFEKSISFEGDSGPYLQYSYVRAKSVLGKAEEHHPLASRTRPIPSTRAAREGAGGADTLLHVIY